MASWQQEITSLLQEAQSIAVRSDIKQELTETEKETARANIGITSSATVISDDDFSINIDW